MKMQRKLQKQHIKRTTLKEAALQSVLLTEEQFDEIC